MSSLDIINAKKEKVGQVALADSFLTRKPNKAVLYQAVRRSLAGRHHGTVDTKTRAEVNFTSKKMYRQKGTGNARHSSRKTSPFVGGGRVFGPHQRDHALGMNKKVRRLALREALAGQFQGHHVVVVQEVPLKQIKTRDARSFFEGIGVHAGLVVLEAPSEIIKKSVRNLPDFKVIFADQLNVFDILKYPKLIFTSKAFEMVSQKLS